MTTFPLMQFPGGQPVPPPPVGPTPLGNSVVDILERTAAVLEHKLHGATDEQFDYIDRLTRLLGNYVASELADDDDDLDLIE